MNHISKFIPFVSFLLIILLVIYAINTGPSILRKDTSIAKLEKNMNHYEGKEVILGIIPLQETREKSILVSDWDKKSMAEVTLPDISMIDGELKMGAIVTVIGTSYLGSKGIIEAQEIHVHQNYFWRMYLSPAGLIFLLYLMHRDRIIRRLYA